MAALFRGSRVRLRLLVITKEMVHFAAFTRGDHAVGSEKSRGAVDAGAIQDIDRTGFHVNSGGNDLRRVRLHPDLGVDAGPGLGR